MNEPTYPRPWLPRFHTIRTDIVDLVLKALGPMHIGPKTPPLSEHHLIQRRDKVIYRAHSLGIHVDLIKVHLQGFTRRANASLGDHRTLNDITYDCQHFLTFFLDDILFNSISLLDYTGNLAGAVILGANHQKLNWNGLIRASHDRGNRLFETKVAKTARGINAEWADRLAEVRALVIHHGINLGKGKQVITLAQDDWVSTLHFTIPSRLESRLRFLQTLRKDGEVDIVDGAEAIALRTLDATSAIVVALIDDIGGRIQKKDPTEQSRGHGNT